MPHGKGSRNRRGRESVELLDHAIMVRFLHLGHWDRGVMYETDALLEQFPTWRGGFINRVIKALKAEAGLGPSRPPVQGLVLSVREKPELEDYIRSMGIDTTGRPQGRALE